MTLPLTLQGDGAFDGSLFAVRYIADVVAPQCHLQRWVEVEDRRMAALRVASQDG